MSALHVNKCLLFSLPLSPPTPPLVYFQSRCIGCSCAQWLFCPPRIPHIVTCLSGDGTHQHLVYSKMEGVYFHKTEGLWRAGSKWRRDWFLSGLVSVILFTLWSRCRWKQETAACRVIFYNLPVISRSQQIHTKDDLQRFNSSLCISALRHVERSSWTGRFSLIPPSLWGAFFYRGLKPESCEWLPELWRDDSPQASCPPAKGTRLEEIGGWLLLGELTGRGGGFCRRPTACTCSSAPECHRGRSAWSLAGASAEDAGPFQRLGSRSASCIQQSLPKRTRLAAAWDFSLQPRFIFLRECEAVWEFGGQPGVPPEWAAVSGRAQRELG